MRDMGEIGVDKKALPGKAGTGHAVFLGTLIGGG